MIKLVNAYINELSIVEILYTDHLNFNPFDNGIMFISASSGCFWTTGKLPGFAGSVLKPLKYFETKPEWQLLSVTDECEVDDNSILSIILYSLGLGTNHGDKYYSVMNNFEKRLSTSDILELHKLYNIKSNQEVAYCPLNDGEEFPRPVFKHRLCDGGKDCDNWEDEIKPCGNIQLTDAGCCQTLIIPVNNIKCKSDGTYAGADIYKCDNEFNYIYKEGGYFVVGFLGDPRLMSQKAWSYKIPVVNNCPDTSQPWSSSSSSISIICESAPDIRSDKR